MIIMIIYFYLTIIVVCSIITGIITTIIEKKGFYTETIEKESVPKENSASVSNQEEIAVRKAYTMTIAIHVIHPDPDYDDDEPILLID